MWTDVTLWTGGLAERLTQEEGQLVQSDWDTNEDNLLNLTEFESPRPLITDAELWEAGNGAMLPALSEHNRSVWFANSGQPSFLSGEGTGVEMNETDVLDATYVQHENVFDRVDTNIDNSIDWSEESRMEIPMHVAISPLALVLVMASSLAHARTGASRSGHPDRRLNLSRVMSTSHPRDGARWSQTEPAVLGRQDTCRRLLPRMPRTCGCSW